MAAVIFDESNGTTLPSRFVIFSNTVSTSGNSDC
jgi:hypothetical protein